MLDYVPFYTHIWADKNFKALSNNAKLLFIYLFTNKEVTLTGIYELDLVVCQIKVGLNSDFNKDFAEVIESKMVEYDSTKEMVWVINRFKLIPTKSPKVIAGVVRELAIITHPFKNSFIEKYNDYIKSAMWRLPEYSETIDTDYFLKPDQLKELHKFYKTKTGLKKFLINRGCAEQNIDEILPLVLPQIKE